MNSDNKNYYGGSRKDDYNSDNLTNSSGERKYFDDSLLKKRAQHQGFGEDDLDIYDKYTNYNTYENSNDLHDSSNAVGYPADETPLSRSYSTFDVENFNRAERRTDRVKRDRQVPDDSKKTRKNPKSNNDDDVDISSGAPKKASRKKKILSGIAIALAVLIVLGSGIAFGVTKWYNDNLKPQDGNAPKPVEQIRHGIKNVVLFGVDSRSGNFKGHSDVIMVVSLNFDTAEVKIVSILRDSYVEIEGHKKQKITNAYNFGGPSLTIDTINQNFDLDIQDYVTVNFDSLADIIDTLGGVEIDVTEFERTKLNFHGSETYKDFKKLTKTGKVKLNGQQAVSYARLRHDGDDNRALRQREVLEQIYGKVMSMPASKYVSLVNTLLPYVETSLDIKEILEIMQMVPKGIKVHQTSVPDYKYEKDLVGKQFNGEDSPWEWRFDTHEAGKRIYRFIYEDDYSSEIVPNLPSADKK